jgi:hypothetical protein
VPYNFPVQHGDPGFKLLGVAFEVDDLYIF